MATFPIRVFGDLGLKQRCPDVTEFDGALARLADDMIETMYAAPGVGLAANQVGVQKRIFVYDAGEGPVTVVDPTIVETSETRADAPRGPRARWSSPSPTGSGAGAATSCRARSSGRPRSSACGSSPPSAARRRSTTSPAAAPSSASWSPSAS